MSRSSNSESNVEPNLTPVLDMVFQLITFFMLVINFKNASVDQSLRLPVIGSALPVAGSEGSLVLNITAEGKLRVQGRDRENVREYIASEGQAAQLMARKNNSNYKPGDDLGETVVIRADRDTRFHYIYSVVRACQEQGFHKFNYMAMGTPPASKPPEGK